MIALDVVVESGGWDAERAERVARRAAEAAVAESGETGSFEASLLLADDAAIRALNLAWRGQDKPTNVLSFPSDIPARDGEAHHLGDVAIAFETLVREADADGKEFDAHLAHLVVHGVLHLLGHDHEDDDEGDAMENAERAALAAIGVADPYREPA